MNAVAGKLMARCAGRRAPCTPPSPEDSRLRPSRNTAIAAALLLLCATGTVAQPPPIFLPGQIERHFRPRPEPGDHAATPRLSVVEARKPPAPDSPRFVPRSIELEGGDALPTESVRVLVSPYLDREQDLAELGQLAAELTALLREQADPLSQVIVPAQSVTGGAVKLRTVAGTLTRVRIEGGNPAQRELAARLAAPLASTVPLTDEALERCLLLIGDLPGIVVHARLEPSTERIAQAELHLRLERRPSEPALSVDNRNGRALGGERLVARFAGGGLAGGSEHTELTVSASPGRALRLVALDHQLPADASGGRLGIALSGARLRSDESSPAAGGNDSRSTSLSLSYARPLERSLAKSAFLRASLDAQQGEMRSDPAEERKDQLRSLRFGLRLDTSGRRGRHTLLDLEASIGLPMLGASDADDRRLTRPGGNPDYQKLNLYAAHRADFAPGWSVLGALSGQYAFNDLLGAELFAFGGDSFGRGYDPAELVGDHGLAARLELRRAARTALPHGPHYQLYGFYDIGKVWSRAESAGAGNPSAASAGLGARLALGEALSGFVELARPLTRDVAAESDRSTRLFAGLAARL